MKKTIFILSVIGILFGCSDPLDNQINKEDFPDVKEHINSNANYSEMKKKFIIDKLSMQMGFLDIAKSMDMDKKSNVPTFKKQVDKLAIEYDSIKTVKQQAIQNNKKLESFIKLDSADIIGISKYKGYFKLKLKFSDVFEKDVLYVILNYRYEDEYDTEYFNANAKLKDKIANNFKGEAEILTTEEYNDAAEFIYTKVPVGASEAMEKELGKEIADEKVTYDFLMKGFEVKALKVVFKDKSEISFEDADWEYL